MTENVDFLLMRKGSAVAVICFTQIVDRKMGRWRCRRRRRGVGHVPLSLLSLSLLLLLYLSFLQLSPSLSLLPSFHQRYKGYMFETLPILRSHLSLFRNLSIICFGDILSRYALFLGPTTPSARIHTFCFSSGHSCSLFRCWNQNLHPPEQILSRSCL